MRSHPYFYDVIGETQQPVRTQAQRDELLGWHFDQVQRKAWLDSFVEQLVVPSLHRDTNRSSQNMLIDAGYTDLGTVQYSSDTIEGTPHRIDHEHKKNILRRALNLLDVKNYVDDRWGL